MKFKVIWIAGLMLAAMAGQVEAGMIVAGNANIFGAGHQTPPAPGGSGAGVLPVQVPRLFTPGSSITFSSVTGLVNEGGGTQGNRMSAMCLVQSLQGSSLRQ